MFSNGMMRSAPKFGVVYRHRNNLNDSEKELMGENRDSDPKVQSSTVY